MGAHGFDFCICSRGIGIFACTFCPVEHQPGPARDHYPPLQWDASASPPRHGSDRRVPLRCLVRDVYELVGRDHVVFITDAMAAAGMPDGAYTLGPQDVVVRDGIARLAQGESIAGGTAHLLDCVRVASTLGGIPLVDAVYMASVQGATILGDERIGSLEAGKFADVVEVDSALNVRRVLRRGTVVE